MIAVLLAGLSAGLALFGLKTLVDAAEPPAMEIETSPLVLDREGRLLRAFAVAGGRWRLPLTLADLDPRFVDMLLAFEDRRFREHRGVDVRAAARAFHDRVRHGVRSGASTITMQLASLLDADLQKELVGTYTDANGNRLVIAAEGGLTPTRIEWKDPRYP